MKAIFLLFVGALLGITLLPYLLFRQKDMPPGTNLTSPAYHFNSAELLIDRSAWSADTGQSLGERHIFDAILREIALAESLLVADFFLWHPWTRAVKADSRPLADELAEALIDKRIQNPEMPMLVITDPINRIYGDLAPPHFQRMADADIPVVYTALGELPESNKLYAPQASFWSKFFPEKSLDEARTVPNPLNPKGKKLTLAEFARLLHFKANHRKLLITGRSDDPLRLLLSSFNPADASANHSNMGLLVDGPVARFAAKSELTIARWSIADSSNVQGDLVATATQAIADIEAHLLTYPEADPAAADPAAADQAAADQAAADQAEAAQATVAYRSEEAIRDELLLQLQKAALGTRIDLALFYFSDRLVIEALKAAVERGAHVRVLLDANRHAFGRKKSGIPNRLVAAELMELAVHHPLKLRWAATNSEQFHSKALRISGPGQELLFLGSANWTRRNIGNLNLEANLLLQDAPSINDEFDRYYDSVWTNARGLEESLPYDVWAETGWSLRWKTWLYRLQEWSGASKF